MRRRSPRVLRAVLLAAAVAGCAGSGASGSPFHAADPSQAVPHDAAAAQAEVAGVALRATLGGWRGDPRDLELRLTPVDATIRNGSGKPLRLGPEEFTLVSGGARWRVLDQDQVSRALAGLSGFRRPPPPRTGAVGGPTFPGYDGPRPYGPGSEAPANAPVPAPGQWYASQLPSATLAPGETTSVLLFFETPARTLRGAALEVALVAGDGANLGTISLPFRKD